MISVVFVVVFAVVMAGVGWPVVARLDSNRRLGEGERLVLSFVSGCFAIYFGVFAIGPFRLDAVSMWGLAVVCLAASLPGLKAMPWAAMAGAVAGEFRRARAEPWRAVLWLTALGIGLSALLQGMAPPNDYDSLMYHISFPQFDLERGYVDIPWGRRAAYVAFFPALTGNLTRFALAVMNAGVAQMLHGLFGIAAAAGAAMVARRLGYSMMVALIAAIMFLAIRAVIWQMATSETDTPLAAFAVLSLVIYLAWRRNDETGLGLLFGLMIGGAILVKYIGFVVAAALAPLILFDAISRRVSWLRGMAGPAAALAVIAPHMIRNAVITGNPVFPLFNTLFNPGNPDFLHSVGDWSGEGWGFVDLITTPWKIFIVPMHSFDGMAFGAPYLLALAPLILLDRKRLSGWWPALSTVLSYFVLWFYFLTHFGRFLLPLAPVLAAAAAVGAAALWEKARNHPLPKVAFIAIAATLAVNQAMFVGVYAGIRLPVAVGLIDAATFHSRTPTMNGAFYKTCTYVRDNLKAGERYYSNLVLQSFYCPQVPATYIYFADEAKWWLTSATPPKMPLEEFLRRAEEANFRYFILFRSREHRQTPTARSVIIPADFSVVRFGAYLKLVVDELQPLSEGPYSAVYDGAEVIALLKENTP